MSEDKNFYQTIDKEAKAEFKDRGSKFLAYAFPILQVTEFKEKLSALKKEHLKANHHCFAYRLGLDGNNFRASDDGEPSGSSGRPILGQIDSRGVTNTAVVVVRYFGGTLLGVPGLINAYKTATALALQLVPIVRKPVMSAIQFDFDYTRMNDVMHWIKRFNGEVTHQEMQLFCMIQCQIPKSQKADAAFALKDLLGLEYKWLDNDMD